MIILSLFAYFSYGVNQVTGNKTRANLYCMLPVNELQAFTNEIVYFRVKAELNNPAAIVRIGGRNIWLRYDHYSQYINEDGLASEGFDWPTDHNLIMIIQGRQTPNANGYREWGQIEIYTSESVPDKYWVLGYNNLRLLSDANGNHTGFHPCIAFETDNLYGLIK